MARLRPLPAARPCPDLWETVGASLEDVTILMPVQLLNGDQENEHINLNVAPNSLFAPTAWLPPAREIGGAETEGRQRQRKKRGRETGIRELGGAIGSHAMVMDVVASGCNLYRQTHNKDGVMDTRIATLVGQELTCRSCLEARFSAYSR